MPQQRDGDAPALAVAVEGGGTLIDAHGNAGASLQMTLFEARTVADVDMSCTMRCLSFIPMIGPVRIHA